MEAAGERKLLPGQPFLGVTHWEQPLMDQHCLGGFGIPCTLLALNPTFVVGLLSGAACATFLPPSALTPGWGASALALLDSSRKKSLLTSRDDAEIRNCSLFSWTFSPLGLVGRGTLTWLCSGTKGWPGAEAAQFQH